MLRARTAPSGAAQRGTPLRVAAEATGKESRVGKLPVPVPKGVTVTIVDNKMTAKARGGSGWASPVLV